MRYNFFNVAAVLSFALTATESAQAPQDPVPDVLLMTCLTPDEQAKMRGQRDSLVVLETRAKGHVYELVLLPGRWLLLFHGSPTEICIIDQGRILKVNPDLDRYIRELAIEPQPPAQDRATGGNEGRDDP